MHLAFDIGLGVGLSAAAGMRPFLPALLAGVLGAAGALGVGFAHSSYRFLQDGWWLVAVAAALLIAWLVQLRIGAQRFQNGPPAGAVAGLGVGTGAVLFAGTLAFHGYTSWPGLIAGALCALVAQLAIHPLLAGASGRLADRTARESLTLYLDGAALLLAGVACLFHPLGFVALALLAWLLGAARRRGSRKYAGLRILGGDG